MNEFERSVGEETAPARKALTDAQQTVNTQAAEVAKAASVPNSEPVKKAEESQKAE
jgi:hypothetical protein